MKLYGVTERDLSRLNEVEWREKRRFDGLREALWREHLDGHVVTEGFGGLREALWRETERLMD